ncbi:hypothetical protein [Haloarcula nitratireducens]|uniref:DUF7992 domain-containing protein n=1 Tax=Haloarcula nitratireducens TaxID=2487749 RepID=A0AAW4PAF1_9EURY|nr:hypothetical protein [Halomicroarcula nitratireducens]MBX0294640.1 hypothetical protein [Halomicroarcula nitratireducens]
MALDIEDPEPPDLSNRGTPRDFEWQEETLGSEDFYREDIEDLLQEGAWKEGFDEWAEYTNLDEEHVRIVSDLGLFRAFDFYWDPTEDRLRFDTPVIPDDWRERNATESLDSSTVSMIDGELADLGQAVREVLEDYLERDDEAADYEWGEEAYGKRGE